MLPNIGISMVCDSHRLISNNIVKYSQTILNIIELELMPNWNDSKTRGAR